jgi:hypothetical protein
VPSFMFRAHLGQADLAELAIGYRFMKPSAHLPFR